MSAFTTEQQALANRICNYLLDMHERGAEEYGSLELLHTMFCSDHNRTWFANFLVEMGKSDEFPIKVEYTQSGPKNMLQITHFEPIVDENAEEAE